MSCDLFLHVLRALVLHAPTTADFQLDSGSVGTFNFPHRSDSLLLSMSSYILTRMGLMTTRNVSPLCFSTRFGTKNMRTGGPG